MFLSNDTLLKALRLEVKDKAVNDSHADYAMREVCKYLNRFSHDSNSELRLSIVRAGLKLATVGNQKLTGEQCATMIINQLKVR
jgi:hypothetical protein